MMFSGDEDYGDEITSGPSYDDGPDCDPGCHQGSHTETCEWYDWAYPDDTPAPAPPDCDEWRENGSCIHSAHTA